MIHVSASARDSHDQGLETEPVAVESVFPRPQEVRRYVEHLATTGVEHGLIGPRELSRLWSRHVLNCGVIEEVVPHQAHVIDIGSGAGLPGIPLALARDDLQVTLIEPLERRCRWLNTVVEDLKLGDRIEVRRGRAEEFFGTISARVVTSRAVAALPKLLAWSLPLVEPGGVVLAMKGERADEERSAVSTGLRRLGMESTVTKCGMDKLDEPVRIVRVDVPERISAGKARRLATAGTSTSRRKVGGGSSRR